MKRAKLLKEEILYYLTEAWNDSLKTGEGGEWLTTRAFQLKLKERGIVTTWPTLALRMSALYNAKQIEKIRTSNGSVWKPRTDILKL